MAVVRLAAVETAPPPLSEKDPLMLCVDDGAFIVKVPVWIRVKGPLLVVVIVSSNLNWLPVREMPLREVVDTVDVKWDNPLPASCWIEPDDTVVMVTLAALTICNVERGWVAPIEPLSPIEPAPAVKVRLRAVKSLSMVPKKLRAPPPEFNETLFVNVALDANWSVPTVATLPLMWTEGVPVSV